MKIRSYMVAWGIGFKSVHVDLDHSEPLTDEAVDALIDEQTRLYAAREVLEEELRLVTQRLVRSGEAKLKAQEKESDREAG